VETGGCKTIAHNAADELAVTAFLAGDIAFSAIPKVIESTLSETAERDPESIEEVLVLDGQARRTARELIALLSKGSRLPQPVRVS
jgi:1-deoxy-D-xylulose-5-phosphate reductoisomerase